MTNYDENDIFKSNHYIEHFNECYDILSANDRFNYIGIKLEEGEFGDIDKPSFFDKLFKRNKMKDCVTPVHTESKNDVNAKFDEAIDEFMKRDFEPVKGKEGKNTVRDFEQMWYFAQFVRYAEKVVFFENGTGRSPIFVDSPIDADNERLFSISNDNYSIKFKLQWVYDTTIKQMLKVINIKVSRDYGKEMTNEYVIVNGNVKLNDVSDFTLINVVNSILYDATLETYKKIMDKLFTFFEERMMYPCA